jgi:TPP-dependent indolepyruvate ferredoxin oxidoreductase alpha subunit
MNKILTLKDSINLGKKQKIAVSELVNKKGEIFRYIKDGYQFDDEVLEAAHIKKTIRDETIRSEFITNVNKKEKEYPKETESVKNILKTINTLDGQNISENDFYTDDDDTVIIED